MVEEIRNSLINWFVKKVSEIYTWLAKKVLKKENENSVVCGAYYSLPGTKIEKYSTFTKIKNRTRPFSDEKIKEVIQQICKKKSKKLGFFVEFERDAEDEVDLETSVITINTRHPPEIQYYILLHEIGHFLLEEEGRLEDQFKFVQYEKRRNVLYRVNWVEMELAAWDRGLKFAKDNRYPVDEDYYRYIRSRNVYSYFQWAVGKFGKELPKGKKDKKNDMITIVETERKSYIPKKELVTISEAAIEATGTTITPEEKKDGETKTEEKHTKETA